MKKDLQINNDKFNNFVDSFFGNRSSVLNDWPTLSRNIMADIQETDQAFILNAEVPGVPKEEIDINVEGNLLTISAEHREEEGKPEQARGYRRQYQSFRQSFSLPSNVNAEQIEARCENGVLEVTLPKTAASTSRRIEIKTNADRLTSKEKH